MEHNSNIKSMKLYNHVDRIYNELKELGKNDLDAQIFAITKVQDGQADDVANNFAEAYSECILINSA